jgi:hypothetical protein
VFHFKLNLFLIKIFFYLFFQNLKRIRFCGLKAYVFSLPQLGWLIFNMWFDNRPYYLVCFCD